jgi:hypothetical protein
MGEKLADIKDMKMRIEQEKSQMNDLKAEQLNKNRSKITYLRNQIAQNINQQKHRVLMRNK